MRLPAAIAAALVAVWLEISFIAPLRPFGVVPNLVLVVILLLAIRLPASNAVVLAVASGLFIDLTSGSDFGLRTAFYVLLVLLVNLLSRQGTDFNNASIVAGTVVAGTIVLNAAVVADLALSRVALRFGYIASKVGIEVICNLVLLVILRTLFGASGRPASDGLSAGRGRG